VAWRTTRLTERLGLRLPVVQAPMAGGPSTPELVAAVSNAGGLGSLGGAVLAPDALRAAIRAVRALTDRPFAVNLFAPLPPPAADAERVEAVRRALAPFRAELGLADPDPPSPPPNAVEAQLAVVVEERVPVFSFTFGLVPVDAAREAGSMVVGTATTAAEAVELERHGVDAVVAQGFEAGGHRGTFAGSMEQSFVGTLALVPQVVRAVSVPVIAAGGIMDGRGIAAALALGADGVQLGTALLATSESGAPDAWKRALGTATAEGTVVTPLATGRHARMIRNELVETFEAAGIDPLPYPLQALASMDVRQATSDRPDLQVLLAGQGAPLARQLPAAELIAALERETDEALRSLV
jgi:nitronate monooxygenase